MNINLEYNKKIIEIIKTHKNCFSFLLQYSEKYADLNTYILNLTDKFKDIQYSARIYMVLNNIDEFFKCQNPECRKELNHNVKCDPITGPKIKCCSHSCGQKNPAAKLKKENTNILKYGTKSAQSSDVVKNRIKDSMLRKSDEERAEINEKRRRTCFEKYGVDSVNKIQSVHDAQVQTMMNRTDEQRKKSADKTRKTKLEKYGYENYVNSEKAKNTRSMFSDERKSDINDKRKKTCLLKYGVDSVSKIESMKNLMNAARMKTVNSKIYDETIMNMEYLDPLFSKEFFIEHPDQELTWKCRKCGTVFSQKKYPNQKHFARCFKCFPETDGCSNEENEIYNFIKENYGGTIKRNIRNVIAPKELDIYLPEINTAFEYNGIYWHSENMNTSPSYHLSKTELCEKAGIKLIHIFNNEWIFNRKIVESRIKNILGKYEKTVFARKCQIKPVDKNISMQFQQDNHLQGYVPSTKSIGLYFDGQLISLMTFGKCRFNKNYEWELIRYCSKLNYHIPGGASKLLKYFEKTFSPKSLISYADRRWSNGNLYRRLGFELDHISKPNYWYWKNETRGKLESRIKFQKHKLKKILDNFDADLSESENMKNNGYFKIYDCGNLVYVKSY